MSLPDVEPSSQDAPPVVDSVAIVRRQCEGGAIDRGLHLGPLLQHCRTYLLDIANSELPGDLRLQVAPSDVVQETYADAVKAIDQFRGHTEAELRGWLRKMLLNNISDARRFYFRTKKRQTGTLLTLNAPGEWASIGVSDPISSPSSIMQRDEAAARLRLAIAQLPEDYRRVVELRNFKALPFERVGHELGRSPDAARKLWFRAIERLADLMDHESSG